MAEKTYPIPDNPVFNMDIRALLDSDPASASGTFNPLIERLIENLCALKLLLDGKVGAEAMQEYLSSINNSLSGINTALAGKAAATHSHNAATAQAAGFMAAADKAKLDGITAKATANTASTTVPKALGTASAGSEAGFARGDHVHPKPSAADIGAVPTSRKVNNKALSADISLTAADVGALPSNGKAVTAGTADTAKACSGNSATATTAGSCSGNAATATKLATARSIRTNLASGSAANFDGSANITPGVTGILPIANGGTGANNAAAAKAALGIAASLFTLSASGNSGVIKSNSSVTINLGFRPKILFISSASSLTVVFPANNPYILFNDGSFMTINCTFLSNGFKLTETSTVSYSSYGFAYYAIG